MKRPEYQVPPVAPIDQAIAEYAANAGITEVLHFTTNMGFLGIAASGELKSRNDLEEDQYLESIKKMNSASRWKDADWTGYVNLSISRVNKRMFHTSSRNWHPEDGIWWPVLAFDPVILTHPGVVFTTTNNTYHEVVKRGPGLDGLQQLFAPTVPWGYYGSVAQRRATTPSNWTTDPQAEVLYPLSVPLLYLRSVYVLEPEMEDDIHTWLSFCPEGALSGPVTIATRPDVFQ